MQFLLHNWYLILVALASGGLLLWPTFSQGGPGGKVLPADAVRLINREKAVLIDVSEAEEYAAGHAAGSKNVPLAQIETSNALPKNKALPLVVVCPTGARATRAIGILRKAGYENARALAGGLKAWREANLPVEKST